MEESAQAGAASAQQVNVTGNNAYLFVVQSTALTIQDAANNLRNMGTISNTAIGAAMAQYLETKDTASLTAIEAATKMMTQAVDTYRFICTNATEVLRSFPITNEQAGASQDGPKGT